MEDRLKEINRILKNFQFKDRAEYHQLLREKMMIRNWMIKDD